MSIFQRVFWLAFISTKEVVLASAVEQTIRPTRRSCLFADSLRTLLCVRVETPSDSANERRKKWGNPSGPEVCRSSKTRATEHAYLLLLDFDSCASFRNACACVRPKNVQSNRLWVPTSSQGLLDSMGRSRNALCWWICVCRSKFRKLVSIL